MIKIVKFSVDDILFDRKAASEAVGKACSRAVPAKVAGICQLDETVMISIEETPVKENITYDFAPFPAVNEDEVAGEIKSRYYAGFSMLGVFNIAGKKWALFSKTPSGKN
ncbi:MAG: hypothetical protein WCS96_04150 [Victivallales bacterium]